MMNRLKAALPEEKSLGRRNFVFDNAVGDKSPDHQGDRDTVIAKVLSPSLPEIEISLTLIRSFLEVKETKIVFP